MNDQMFTDGSRKIDFVLVYEINMSSEENRAQINRFLDNLGRKGIEFEEVQGVEFTELMFIKLHTPHALLIDLANIHNVILSYQSTRSIPIYKSEFNFFLSPITKQPHPDNPLFKRTTNVVKGKRTKRITSAERILLINHLLTRTRFGKLPNQYGVNQLVRQKTLVAAYPLHDGKWKWAKEGPLNDRQILSRFWASLRSLHKVQPIHVIHKYYGPEVGFYFAWIGYYNRLLIPAAIVGFLIFLYGLLTLGAIDVARIDDICLSKRWMCPKCIGSHCFPKLLSKSCRLTRFSYIFDNWSTVIFAILMSFWATCFVEFWKREQCTHLFQWHLLNIGEDIEVLPEYERRTPYRRVNRNTGVLEAYIPLRIKVYHYFISTVVCLLMIIVVLCSVVAVVFFRHMFQYLVVLTGYPYLTDNSTLVKLISGSTCSALIINILTPLFRDVALRLTRMENPRTQVEFNNSYIFKSYLLAFFNNYLPLFYLALAVEKMFTHPGDRTQYEVMFGIRVDVCHPSGCIIGVTIQLMFLMLMKSFTGKIFCYLKPKIWRCLRRLRKSSKHTRIPKNLPQWEKDFQLEPVEGVFLVSEFMELVLQYGLITFFVAGLPLAPLFALICNVVELRLDAMKFLRNTRRPVPRRIPGLGAWNGILMAITYFGTFCNALVIAFTSEFVPREIYRFVHGNLVGYINSTLSAFPVHDFDDDIEKRLNKYNITTCFYRSHRHNKKHVFDQQYYFNMAMQFAFIVVFEHLVLFLTGVLAYAIPDTPFSVKEEITKEEHETKETLVQEFDREYGTNTKLSIRH